jgi:phosphate-selective porin
MTDRIDRICRRTLACAWLAAAAALAPLAQADIVQGTVTPANAKVVIKDGAGNQVSELGGGAFQVKLPAGRFTAECVTPSQKKTQIFSLAQPTTANIDCT